MLKPVAIDESVSELGEGCVYNQTDNCLYWLDIKEQKVCTYNLSLNKINKYQFSKTISSIAFTTDCKIIATTSDGFEYIDLQSKQITPVIDPEQDKKDNRFNDGKCDKFGRYFAGTMDNNEKIVNGALYCLDQGKAVKKVDNLSISNGLGWNNDSTKFYLTDSPKRVIYEYKYDLQTAQLSEQKIFANIATQDGFPDGLVVDSENHIWSAHWDGWKVTRYAPDGSVDCAVDMPVPRVTCCCFGGKNNNTLFITSAKFGLNSKQLEQAPLSGATFMLATNTTGQKLNLFDKHGNSNER